MIGETLLQYRIVDKLGAGGMGVVYKAVDTRLEREAAIKVLAPEQAADAITHQRFLREARAASALNHPNIVTVYEINSDRGVTFIAMEYISGQTLAQRMSRARLRPAEILEITTQIAAGLAKAHSQGIVHRDLKPRNLMITSDGVLKILDFGLARVAEVSTVENTVQALTVAGSVMGTPGYMSPEQSLGDVADQRSDVFSFGVILYEMVTGVLPFTGDSTPRILRAVVADAPRPIERLPEGLPPEFGALILRCLEKNKEDRYASGAELLRIIEALGRPNSLASAPDATLVAVSPAARPRKQVRWYAAGALAAALLPGGWFVYTQMGRTKPVAQPETFTIDGNASPRELVEQGRRFFSFFYRPKYLDQALSALQAAIAKDAGYAPAHAALAEVYLRRNMNERDPQWVRLADQHAAKAVELNPDLAAAQHALAMVQMERGDRKAARATLRKALDLDPRSGEAQLTLAKLQAADRDTDGAVKSFSEALRLSPDNWLVQMDAGIFHFRQGRYEEAARLWNKAGGLTPDNDLVFRNLSSVYLLQDRFDEAAAAIQRALEIRPSAPHYSNLGYVRFFQGRYLDAIAPFEKAVELSPNKYLYWGNLGDAYRWSPGKADKAKQSFQRALELVRESIATSPNDGDLRGSAAVYLAKSGDGKGALEEVAAIRRLGKTTPGAQFKSALASELAGDRQQALSLLDAALTAGYSLREVKTEPEFTALRRDLRYHQMLAKFPADAKGSK